MKLTVETVVNADLNRVWDTWNNPTDIKQWNSAQDDWHTTRSSVDLREGGKFLSRMEAKDGSEGFDFEGTYTRIVPRKAIEYQMSDGREVKVEFVERRGRPPKGNVRRRDRESARAAAHGLAGHPRKLPQARGGEKRGWLRNVNGLAPLNT